MSPTADQHARDVRDEPARVLHHLQDGEGVALAEAGLVEGLAVVAHGLVHGDEDVAGLPGAGIGEVHQAGEVLRDLGAGVLVVAELLQRHRVGQVLAPVAHGELVGAPLVGEGLGRAEPLRDQPGAVALPPGDGLDEGGALVDLVVGA